MKNVSRLFVWLVPLVLVGDVCQADVTLGPWNTGVVITSQNSDSSLDTEDAASFADHIAFYEAFGATQKDDWQSNTLLERSAKTDSFQSPDEPNFSDDFDNMVDSTPETETTDGLDLDNEEDVSVAAIPEPSIAVIIGLGLMSIVCLRRRRTA